MKLAIFFLSLLGSSAFALDMTKVQVNLPEMNFQNGKGVGIINNLAIEMDGGFTQGLAPQAVVQSKIDFSREGKTFKIATGAFNFVMQNSNDLLMKLTTLQVSKFNVNVGVAGSNQISVDRLFLSHESIGETMAEGFSISCEHKDSIIKDIPQIMDGCLQKGSARAEKFEVPDMDSFFMEAFLGIPAQTADDEIFQTIKDFALDFSKNDFAISLKIKGIPLVRIRAQGNAKVDMVNKQATIRLDKVKLGLLGVTDIVMSQLKKKLPPENFRVEPPFIYATWK